MGSVEVYNKITELLQYFTGTFVIDADGGGTGIAKISAVGIGAGWTIGDIFQLTATANSNIIGQITYIHTDNSYIYATTVAEDGAAVSWGADENGSGDEKMNQIYHTPWQDVTKATVLNGTVYCSGAADIIIQQSWDGVYIDVNGTKVDVSATTATTVSAAVIAKFARLKVLTENADQTVMRGYFGGRAGT